MVNLRGEREIEGLRLAGDLVARTFEVLRPRVRPGVGLDELDHIVEEFLLAHGAESPYRGYQPSSSVPPFPGTVCASVNEQVVHGSRYAGSCARETSSGSTSGPCSMVGSGTPATRILSRECLEAGVAEVRPGGRLGDVGAAIQELAESHGYGVVRELGGHGVGRKLHEEPHVEHFGRRGHGLRLRKGMVFTIEPMINEGSPEIRLQEDGWTVVTGDGKLSAQYEHTVAVTADGCEILTPWRRYTNEGAASA